MFRSQETRQSTRVLASLTMLLLILGSGVDTAPASAAPLPMGRVTATTQTDQRPAGNGKLFLPLVTWAGTNTGGGSEGNFFLPFDLRGVNNTTSPDVAIDPTGGIHVVYRAYSANNNGRTPVYYAYCPGGSRGSCTRATDFTTITLDAPDQSSGPYDATLALDPTGHPRMLWAVYNEYRYLACDAVCTNPNNWSVGTAAHYQNLSDNHSHRLILDSAGHPHFVYLDDSYNDHRGTWYASCETDCTTESNWYEVRVDGGLLSRPSLVLTTSGQPRFAFQFVNSGQTQFGYIECNDGCQNSANWNGVAFGAIVPYYAAFSLRLTHTDQPRMALYPWSASDGPYKDGAKRLYYFSCSTACGRQSDTAWTVKMLGLAEEEGQNVDLALDRNDRPRVAYAKNGGMGYAWCNANCESAAGTWQTASGDSANELNQKEPVHTTPGTCSSPVASATWSFGFWVSLALDSNDNPRIVYDAHHIQLCNNGGRFIVVTDIAWARFRLFNQP